eukprot:239402-Rhodomonas_salina.4
MLCQLAVAASQPASDLRCALSSRPAPAASLPLASPSWHPLPHLCQLSRPPKHAARTRARMH